MQPCGIREIERVGIDRATRTQPTNAIFTLAVFRQLRPSPPLQKETLSLSLSLFLFLSLRSFVRPPVRFRALHQNARAGVVKYSTALLVIELRAEVARHPVADKSRKFHRKPPPFIPNLLICKRLNRDLRAGSATPTSR